MQATPGRRTEPKALAGEFYHCKFSLEEKPGSRIDDLYQVCGLAQKSIHWMRTPETKTNLLTHLLRRDSERREHGSSRVELGDSDLLQTMKEISEMCPMSLSITIGPARTLEADVSFDQLQLLAVTENHLFERADIPSINCGKDEFAKSLKMNAVRSRFGLKMDLVGNRRLSKRRIMSDRTA
jgi:hypothetical protein